MLYFEVMLIANGSVLRLIMVLSRSCDFGSLFSMKYLICFQGWKSKERRALYEGFSGHK